MVTGAGGQDLVRCASESDDTIKVRKRTQEPDKQKDHDDSPQSLESHASLLTDTRLSHPANAAQRAKIMSGLQQSHGNAYVQRLLSSHAVQAKLTVTDPDDQYEKEADRVADEVTSQSAESQVRRQEEEEEELQAKLQRQAEPEEEEELQAKLQRQAMPEEEEEIQAKLQRQAEEEEEPIQAKRAISRTPNVSEDMQSKIDSSRGGGQKLPDSVRSSLEPQLGYDFGDVRIHHDSEADNLSQQLDARAFTTGQDIYFRSGDYQPHSNDGMKLLGHEMTHVVQQEATSLSTKAVQREQEQDPEARHGAELRLLEARDRLLTTMSRANIQAFLRQAALCQQLGADDQARDALDRAADQAIGGLKESTRAFNVDTSSRRAARDLLDQIATVQLLSSEEGAESAAERALGKLLEWAQAQLAGAIRQFQASPGEPTAQLVLERAGLVQMLGGDTSAATAALRSWAQERESS
jgi:hypothetical protein